MKTLLVSPHSDDIAFSIGGTLLKKFFNSPILVVTIFTISNISPCIRKNDSEIISQLRHLEDFEFAEKMGLEFHSFSFPEPTMRGLSLLDLYETNNLNSDPMYNEVETALTKFIKSHQCNMLVSPMGLGNHIDHIMLCDICIQIARENKIKIAFYEDLPYASMMTLKKIKVRAEEISPHLNVCNINITDVFDEKIKNMTIYKTQTCRFIQTKIKLHAMRLNFENNSFIEYIWPNKLFRYLIFFIITRLMRVKLFERIWTYNES